VQNSDSLPTLPRRLIGLGMIGLVVAIIGTCIAAYNKAFSDEVPVTVEIDQVDNSFLANAEVRLRGVTVGRVDSADVRGDDAVLNLALDPEQVGRIPRNVRAMILPKSLFGESFLSLEVPPDPAVQRIMAGDVIPRDRSSRAVQVEQLFTDLLPLIQAVEPDDLAATLGALNQSLTGRGDQLGDTITQLHQYLVRFNTTLPDLTADIRALPPLTETYSQAAPDLIEGLRELNTTSNTLAENRDGFTDLFGEVTEAADDLEGFFDDYGDDVIDLADTASPVLDLLARYAPQNVCFFRRLEDGVRRAGPVFAGEPGRPGLRIRLVITATRGKFLPRLDEPEQKEQRGPRCYDNAPTIEQYPGGPPQDGASDPPAREPGSLSSSAPTGPRDDERLRFYGEERDKDRNYQRDANRSPHSLPMLGGAGASAPAAGTPAAGAPSPPIPLPGAEVRGR
jgi:phospholipid/cholesterol/gamma-HCH transport system substrate-binding protein